MFITLNRRIAGPYLDKLHMGAYSFQLTYNSELDMDHECDLILNWTPSVGQNAEEAAKLEKIDMYDPRGTYPHERRRRYQRLAAFLAQYTGNDEYESKLPRAISQRLAAENGVVDGRHRFRIRRLYTVLPEFWLPDEPQPNDPYDERLYGVVYPADVTFFEGALHISKASSAAEAAPVDRRPGRRDSDRGDSGRGELNRSDSDPIVPKRPESTSGANPESSSNP
jgi:hypothetical protein